MTPITINDLKEGDWFCNEGVFGMSSELNTLSRYRNYAFVYGIIENNVHIKSWGFRGNEIINNLPPDRNDNLFLLDEKEKGEICKKVIVNKLGEEDGN